METETVKTLARVKASPNSQEVRNLADVKIGEVVHQGDLYLRRIHFSEASGETVDSFEPVKNHKFVGKMVALKGKFYAISETILTHPEHAHCRFPAASGWDYLQQEDFMTGQLVAD